MTSHPSLVLLNRHLSLKENAPFTLIVDSLAQSAHYLLQEFVHKCKSPVIYLSFETTFKPDYATEFLDCYKKSPREIRDFLTSVSGSQKSLVIIDSLNYLPDETHASFISEIVSPSVSVVACFHKNVPTAFSLGYPSPMKLLSYIASAIFELEPLDMEDEEELESGISMFRFPINRGWNSEKFKLNLTSRRKSGKSLINSFIVDASSHTYDIYKPKKDENLQNDEDLLKDLTTFNLTTNSRQKLAREQVELPFMEAQTELGKYGGAIVYEFEKDDDYDEEDPYEDPF